jgi:hypothetical protein
VSALTNLMRRSVITIGSITMASFPGKNMRNGGTYYVSDVICPRRWWLHDDGAFRRRLRRLSTLAPWLARAQKIRGSSCLQPQLLFQRRELIGIAGAGGLLQPGGCRAGGLRKYVRARTLE